jgi:uncharacterized protein YbjT (DUF2867 family)
MTAANLVIVGATGMVGGYALRYALERPAVGRATVTCISSPLSRNSVSERSARLRMITSIAVGLWDVDAMSFLITRDESKSTRDHDSKL